jgi:O-antigen biosynthesis protein
VRSSFQTIANFIQKHCGHAGLKAALDRRHAVQFTRNHFKHVIDLAAQDGPALDLPIGTGNGSPLISFVVPVHNARPAYLDDLLSSFNSQQIGLSELVLSDDGSTTNATKRWLLRHSNTKNLTIVSNRQNRGIAAATNSGIARASGRWIGLLDHDDALAPFLVSRLAKALHLKPNCKFLYTDEIITDRKLRPVDYFFKPAWDPVLLSGVNYINHLSLYMRDRLLKIGGLRDGFEGSQDYDLLLRYTADLHDKEIVHLPYPGYLWRRDGKSYSSNFMEVATRNARKALAQHYQNGDEPIEIDQAVSPDLHRVRFDLARSSWALVSVVIPNRNAISLISSVLDSITSKTDYPQLEIIIIDNGTGDPEVLALYERYRQGQVPFRTIISREPFNFSRSVNRGLAAASGDYVLLLNNDIEVLDAGWLKEMVSCFQYPSTGIVGAKLLYPNRTLQHAGVIVGLGGLAGHWFGGLDEDFPGPMGRLWVRQSFSAVTGACMLISRTCVNRVGPFDEARFPIAYNDIDYCLRAASAGFRVVWTPFAKLLHHESASRGSDELPENVERFERDKEALREVHQTLNYDDPTYNPWFSRNHSNPTPVWLNVLPLPR